MGGAIAVVLTGVSASHTHSHLWGNVMIFLAACATSVYMVWFKRVVAKYNVTTVLRWIYCISAVVMLPFGFRAILHTDYAAMTTPSVLASLFVLSAAHLPAQPDAQLCAQDGAAYRVEHLYLPCSP